ncbi:hypothetical protein EDD55_104225 [Varunaivibrio sulfuroxidans]|uniref:Uncharacterized protein n=1 Tax=Varunaivibrio sulfuroxidans TaxID=1773489 RepID=A0A4R3JBP3_9PROT|nr:hypothetical protein EDD55_104225 [Varunaivibrio sulfuroxidans]
MEGLAMEGLWTAVSVEFSAVIRSAAGAPFVVATEGGIGAGSGALAMTGTGGIAEAGASGAPDVGCAGLCTVAGGVGVSGTGIFGVSESVIGAGFSPGFGGAIVTVSDATRVGGDSSVGGVARATGRGAKCRGATILTGFFGCTSNWETGIFAPGMR